jgi:hypothetical protein
MGRKIAVRYGIYRISDMDIIHMAYLWHAVLGLGSVFYRYAVPNGTGIIPEII